jgi:hypothetical protein
MGAAMDRGMMLANAWAAAAFNAVVGSHDLVEAVSGWVEMIGGVLQ